jgi:hypothetical protein
LPSPEADHQPGQELPVVSIWQLKPWWCQPWSILLTGILVVLVSWVVLKLWWLTAAAALLITAWWALFLVMVPAAWKQEQSGAGGN